MSRQDEQLLLGPLTGLSFQHVGGHLDDVAPTPTNEERAQVLRQFWPVELANSYPWAFRDEYARTETLDGRYPTTDI